MKEAETTEDVNFVYHYCVRVEVEDYDPIRFQTGRAFKQLQFHDGVVRNTWRNKA